METTDICPYCSTPMGERLRDEYYYTCVKCLDVFIHYDTAPLSAETLFKNPEMGSPVMNGSRGKVDDKTFTVTGCAVIFQERSTLIMHSIQWSDDIHSFLIENDGDFFMAASMVDAMPGNFKNVRPGKEIKTMSLDKAYCYSMDKIHYISLSGNGKLAFSKYTGSVCCGFYKDMTEGAYAFISNKDASFLSGKFYEFKDLNLSPVKALHEWYK